MPPNPTTGDPKADRSVVALRESLREIIAEVERLPPSATGYKEKLDEMASHAETLRQRLHALGHAPKHSNALIQNRGVQPDEPEFYRHIAAAKDLLGLVEPE